MPLSLNSFNLNINISTAVHFALESGNITPVGPSNVGFEGSPIDIFNIETNAFRVGGYGGMRR